MFYHFFIDNNVWIVWESNPCLPLRRPLPIEVYTHFNSYCGYNGARTHNIA